MSNKDSNNKIDLDHFEKNSRDIFANEIDGRERILEAFAQIPEDKRHQYPEIAFYAAKVFINRGQHANARKQLQICAQAWKTDQENLARVYLLHAYLCKLEHDLIGLKDFAAKVQKISKDDNLLAECQILLGDAVIDTDPSKALQYFDEARKRYIRSSVLNPLTTPDAVRASLRAAGVAIRQGKRVIARQYQRYARDATQQYGNVDLLCAVLMRTADVHEIEGDYALAQSTHNEALQYAEDNPQKSVALDYRRAKLAYLINDDRTASDILKHSIHTDHIYTLCQWILCQGWLAALCYEVQDAAHKLEEVRAIVRGDERIINQIYLLEGLIAAQSGTISDDIIQATLAAKDYFVKHHLIIEASQAKLILAWLSALQGNDGHVILLMDDLELDIQRLDHVQHLARLYQISIAVLGGWWSETVTTQMEQTLASREYGEGIRVYAMGVPRVFVQGGELKQRDRYGRISVQLLIYMLEKRQAKLHEITEALWEESDGSNISQRFHTLMSNTKKQLGTSDWCAYSNERRMYIVKEEFPHYYDARDFRNTFDLLQLSKQPLQSLTHCLKLINMYNTFARGFDNEAFIDLRHQYEALISRTLLTAGDLLPEVVNDLPREWHEQLTTKIESFEY